MTAKPQPYAGVYNLDNFFTTDMAARSGGDLKSALEPVRKQAKLSAQDEYARSLKRLASNQAARGVLRSGVSEPARVELERTANLSAGEAEARLAQMFASSEGQLALARTSAALDDLLARQGHKRNKEMANLIAQNSKPSMLSKIFGGASAGAGAGSAFGPWGAAFGGIGGGLAGAFS